MQSIGEAVNHPKLSETWINNGFPIAVGMKLPLQLILYSLYTLASTNTMRQCKAGQTDRKE